MAKIETQFTTKTGENPYPLGPQILYSPYKGSNLPLEDSKQWLLVDTPEFCEIIRNLVNKHQNTQNVMRPAQSHKACSEHGTLSHRQPIITRRFRRATRLASSICVLCIRERAINILWD